MTQEEFISKYRDVEMSFSSIDKFRMYYINTELGISCSGCIDYKDNMLLIETVCSIAQLEFFEFKTQPNER